MARYVFFLYRLARNSRNNFSRRVEGGIGGLVPLQEHEQWIKWIGDARSPLRFGARSRALVIDTVRLRRDEHAGVLCILFCLALCSEGAMK